MPPHLRPVPHPFPMQATVSMRGPAAAMVPRPIRMAAMRVQASAHAEEAPASMSVSRRSALLAAGSTPLLAVAAPLLASFIQVRMARAAGDADNASRPR